MPRTSTSDGHAAIRLRIAKEIVQRREVQNLRSIVRGLIENSARREVMAEQDVQESLLRLNEAETVEDVEQIGDELVDSGYVPAFFPRNQLEQSAASKIDGNGTAQPESEDAGDQSERETKATELKNEVASLRQENQSLHQANERLIDKVDQLQEQVAAFHASRIEKTHTSGELGEDARETSASETKPLTVEELGEIVDELDLDIDWEDYEFPVIIRGRDERDESNSTE